jgi:hypothetical protein
MLDVLYHRLGMLNFTLISAVQVKGAEKERFGAPHLGNQLILLSK